MIVEPDDFWSPCAGIVYLYDKAEDPAKPKGTGGEAPVAVGRPIRPVAGKPGDKPGGKAPALPLVLTQIKFTREMMAGSARASQPTRPQPAGQISSVISRRHAHRFATS